MSAFLIGLQYAGFAFGVFMLLVIGLLIVCGIVRLVYGPHYEGDDIGAPEGDDRHFREY